MIEIEKKFIVFISFPLFYKSLHGIRTMDEIMDLYSSPSLHISNCVTIKLTEQNYIIWKSQFESFLRTQILIGFVNGAIKPPQETIPIRNKDGLVEEVMNPDY